MPQIQRLLFICDGLSKRGEDCVVVTFSVANDTMPELKHVAADNREQLSDSGNGTMLLLVLKEKAAAKYAKGAYYHLDLTGAAEARPPMIRLKKAGEKETDGFPDVTAESSLPRTGRAGRGDDSPAA